MRINFRGKTALITGASDGIGKTIYNDFKKLGAKVIGTCNQKKMKGLIQVDFNDTRSVKKFLEKINKYKKIDILINNAGTNILNPVNKLIENDIYKLININTVGPTLITKVISKKMIKNRYGRIINMCSIFGEITKEKRVLYNITKFGLNGLTKGSAIDLAKSQILVNSISPGFVSTKLTKKILGKKINTLKKEIPLKRLASSDEISKIVLFLASDLNTYLTGQNIIVDGGFTSK